MVKYCRKNYSYTLEIYACKRPKLTSKFSNESTYVEKIITEAIYESDHNDTVGNCFSCINLVNKITEKKLSYTDACKKQNKRHCLKF